MFVFDQMNITDRGNATYDPGSTQTTAHQNMKTVRPNFKRMLTVNWAMAPNGATSTDANGNPIWQFGMLWGDSTSAHTRLSTYQAANTGSTISAGVMDVQFNYMDPYMVLTKLWGYRGVNINADGPEITEMAFTRACDYARQYAWKLYDGIVAWKRIHPGLPIGCYYQPGGSQDYNWNWADANYSTYRSAYPAGRRWAARGRQFMREFISWFDFLAPSCYNFNVNSTVSLSAYHSSGKADWEYVTERDIMWCRQFNKPIIPYMSPSPHASVTGYAGGLLLHSDVLEQQLLFVQNILDVFGVILWDTDYQRSNKPTATAYNTGGIWTTIDKFVVGGSNYEDITLKTGGPLFPAGSWGL